MLYQLSYRGIWSRWRDSNSQPYTWQAYALPVVLHLHIWSLRQESNLQPIHYKWIALPIAPRRHILSALRSANRTFDYNFVLLYLIDYELPSFNLRGLAADNSLLMILPYLSHYPCHIVYFYLCLVIKSLRTFPQLMIKNFCFSIAELRVFS